MAATADSKRKADLVTLVDAIRTTVMDNESGYEESTVQRIREALTDSGLEPVHEKEWVLRVKTRSQQEIQEYTARDWIHTAMAQWFNSEACVFGELDFHEAIEIVSLERLV